MTESDAVGKRIQLVRNSNFELLRIICMLLIVAYHYVLHGRGEAMFGADFSLNQVFAVMFGSWGLVGVNCFLFISAYFLIGRNAFSSKKLMKICLQTIAYSVCIYGALCFSGVIDFGVKGGAKSVLSPFIGAYWFITSYCMLYIISPFLNRIIKNTDPVYFGRFVIVLTLFVPVYAMLPRAGIGDFVFVFYLYLLMGRLKQLENNWFERNAKVGFIVTSSLIVLLMLTVIWATGSRWTGFLLYEVVGGYSPLIIADALFLFYLFKNFHVGRSQIINWVAQGTLGVYLFHENPDFRAVLWDKILQADRMYVLPIFPLALVGSVLGLFALGVSIDALRAAIFGLPVFARFLVKFENVFDSMDLWCKGSDNKV